MHCDLFCDNQPLIDEVRHQLACCGESGRLFHGRGHCFPGLEDVLIDYYPALVLVTLYRDYGDCWLRSLCKYLQAEIPSLATIAVQRRYLSGTPLEAVEGVLPASADIYEQGLRYRLRLDGGQNVGFFPDMAQARRYLRSVASDKKVLNLFAYSCSFSVAAIAGGAAQVVNLDMNRNALALGRLNHQLNDFDLRQASFLPYELFRSVGRLKKLAPFDIIVCDPPADQGKSFSAERDWPKLIRRLPQLLAPGGLFLACASSPKVFPAMLSDLFARHWPQAQLTRQLTAGCSFPEREPDKGLNVLVYRF